MLTRKLALCGVASLAIIAFTGGAFAQADDTSGPQYSTPAEKAATAQLNRQSMDGTYASPDVLNGETSSRVPWTTKTAVADATVEQQQAQMAAEYEAEQRRYEANRAAWRAEHQAYIENLRRYDRGDYDYRDYPHRRHAYHFDETRGQRLYLIADPTAQLSQKPIEDPSGAWVGKVRNVVTAVDGRPARIEVALNRRVSVWVSPSHFLYDPVDGIVYTDLSRADLWQRPGARVEGAAIY